jgi:hypothetical protein
MWQRNEIRNGIVFRPVPELKVSDVRHLGGEITAIRASTSGKTYWITSPMGTEKISADASVALKA